MGPDEPISSGHQPYSRNRVNQEIGRVSILALCRNLSMLNIPSSEILFPLSSSLIQKAINAFFLHSHNQPYSFFCESRFRQRALDRILPDHVIYAVVASAARFMEDQYSKSNFGALCAQKSWDLLLKHLHSDTDADLGFVQATTLLALFDFTGM